MMKVLLVQPNTCTIRGLPQPPLALMYIGSYAEKRGHAVKIIDRNIKTNSREIIDAYKPDVVGITSLTGRMILDGIKVSKYVRSKFPNTKIVWGGIHTSLLPENTLDNEFIDFVIIGEGEESFIELLDAIEDKKKDFRHILGIGYKEGQKIIINNPRPLIKELDTLPLLPWHVIDVEQYLKYETLFITSRGCPHRCAFCYNEKFYFRQWRSMSPERVRAEIEHAQLYHPIRRFRFDDDNFTVNKERFYKILDFLPKNISLYFETRVDYIDEEFCKRVSEFKDTFLFIGIESGDDEMLRKMQKDITVSQIRRAFRILHKYNIKTSGSFIIGAPGETRFQINKTLELIDEIKPTRPSCCIYVPFPGAKFTGQLIKNGRLRKFQTLMDWGKFTDSEFSKYNQFSEASQLELNRIYSRYWWKFVRRFALKLRFGWIYIGTKNLMKIYYRSLLRYINRDI